MKITIPAIQIDEAEGFSPAKDIFSRKDFGERLASLIVKTNDELVIALDAEWGEGKSTFVQMWKGYVSHQREQKIRTVYFDAFANDYQKDPFIALAAEVYELLKDAGQEKKKEFIAKAGAAAKSMARGAMKIAVRVGTGGLLDGSLIDGVGDDVSELLSEQVDSILEERLKSSSEDKLALKNFRKYLADFALENGDGRPIVFVIDELDRCRPDFALELIEQIKHLFSVRGITFLLVMNKKQLEESIRAKYGLVDAAKYLQKFVHLWLTLPRKSDQYDDHGVKYVRHTMLAMCDSGENILNGEAISLFEELIKYCRPSFREIERALSYFALIQNMSRTEPLRTLYQFMVAFVCFLKATKPHLIRKITHEQIGSKILLEDAGLGRVDGNNRSTYLFDLTKLVIFDMGSEEQRKAMMEAQEVFADGGFGRFPDSGVMRNVCGWLDDINRAR
ncbi:MAG: hypothetical protein FD173_1580 [Gallionellaceae bacterium]|nr:MAG: hypothetical protein FD173_1580 [Gallionellaceae bacterium]